MGKTPLPSPLRYASASRPASGQRAALRVRWHTLLRPCPVLLATSSRWTRYKIEGQWAVAVTFAGRGTRALPRSYLARGVGTGVRGPQLLSMC